MPQLSTVAPHPHPNLLKEILRSSAHYERQNVLEAEFVYVQNVSRNDQTSWFAFISLNIFISAFGDH